MDVRILGVWGAYPEAGGATSSFLLNADDYHLLVDCGSGILSQLQNYIPLDKLDALLLSHYHQDHTADVGVLQYGIMIQNLLKQQAKILPIYAHSLDPMFKSFNKEDVSEAFEIKETESSSIGPFEVSFCPTVHPVYTLATKFKYQGKTLVYTSDTDWSDELVDFAKGADVVISEANLYNDQLGQVNGHLTAGEAGVLAQASKASKLVLTHLPHHGNLGLLVEQAKEKFSGEVILAEPGIVINI